MKNKFEQSVNMALKHFTDLEWLGKYSPLASPYFLGSHLHTVDHPETVTGRGEALQLALQRAADTLWPGTLPQSRHSLLVEVEAERTEIGNGGPRYLYLLLDLRYIRRFFPPRTRPNTVGSIHTYLNVSETRFFVHLNSARKQFTRSLLHLIKPSLRLERPIVNANLLGRKQIIQQILADLQNKHGVSLSGVGGIGKTSVGTAVASEWGKPIFWYTFHPGLNDDLGSLLFSLGHFLYQWGFPNLWLHLMAQNGQIGDNSQAFGFLREDLDQAKGIPLLLCFDEMDLLQTAVSQPRHSEHRQILELFEGIKGIVPLLFIGQQAILDTESHYSLNALTIESFTKLIIQHGHNPDNLNINRIHQLTEGNPRFLELYLALIYQTEIKDRDRFLRSPSLKPTFSRLWKRLIKSEKLILSQLAVYRSNAPKNLWSNNDGFQSLTNRKLLKFDNYGGVSILPAFRNLIYEQLSEQSRRTFHNQAVITRSEHGQITEATYHLIQSGDIVSAINLWFNNQDSEIEQGRAGAAQALFVELPSENLPTEYAKKLKVIQDRLDLLHGNSASILKDIDQYSWHPDENISAIAQQQWGEANFRLGKTDDALQNYDQAITVLTNIASQITFLHLRRGQILLEQGNKQDAKKETILIHFEVARLNGHIARASGDYLQAKKHFEDALQLAKSASDEAKIAQASYSLAMTIGNAGSPDLGQEYAKPALEYYERIGSRVQLEGLRAELASNYLNNGQFAKVIEPTEKALRFFEKINHDLWVGHLSSNLAEAYFETGNIDLAEQYAYRAINSEHPTIQPYAIYTLGQVHAAKQKFDLAEQALENGIEAAKNIGDQFIEAYLCRIFGQILLQNQKSDDAQVKLHDALTLFTNLGLKHEQERTEHILSSTKKQI